MKKNKITFLKEKEIEKKAQKNLEKITKGNIQNPIKSQFSAFQKTKRKVTFDDLF